LQHNLEDHDGYHPVSVVELELDNRLSGTVSEGKMTWSAGTSTALFVKYASSNVRDRSAVVAVVVYVDNNVSLEISLDMFLIHVPISTTIRAKQLHSCQTQSLHCFLPFLVGF
jgi:hypothetical protein